MESKSFAQAALDTIHQFIDKNPNNPKKYFGIWIEILDMVDGIVLSFRQHKDLEEEAAPTARE